jgi:phospholipid/cholesterol/gamma-HCH transport system ATP-binding protein
MSADSSLPHEAGGEPLVRVRGLRVRYGELEVLCGIDLDVYRGETMVILGPSGCGKSTLLRHLEGLARPLAGSITIAGLDIVKASRRQLARIRRLMGVSFQSAAMFNSMTVGDNVALPLREHTDLADSTIRLVTRMKLQQVGLSGVEDLYPAQLSGGMRKRASLARALALDPEILLFDEPSAGLDPIIAAGIDQLILRLKEAFRMTIIVVTHEMQSAFLIADRMCMLDQGRILAVGTASEIRRHPHPRVRQFVQRIPDALDEGSSGYITGFSG